ncbi:hypothetical protein F7725_017855 [Dissostichus mawsoni]|uniref:Uncharacterized protein n=1 Tax=Dissostichus mawsoni TaxID=36200 RepID=A0A7J5XSR1_DISMA|nr:hypothetical protein F7725_017855 [Dissostichus mawsoni]
MSSSSWELKEALAPSVLARIFSTCPLSEPRNTTVWFLLGPADVSTAIWGTDSSISGYDLMKVSVSSGKVVDDL